MLGKTMATTGHELLDSRLERLSCLLPVSSKALALIRSYILDAPDDALARINPHAFAHERDISTDEAVPLFLCGVRAGLFFMEWAMVCRGCGEVAEVSGELAALGDHFECGACSTQRETSLDQCVQVLFTVVPEIRELSFHNPDKLALEPYFFDYVFSRSILLRGTERRLVDYLSSNRRVLTSLEPGAEHVEVVELDVGWMVGSPRAMITVSSDAAENPEELCLTFDGTSFEPRPTIRPGRIRLRLRNESDRVVPTLLYFTPEVTYFDYEPFLSGRDVLNTAEFRRHLHTQVVQPGTGLPVSDNTILFVDFVGSTATYDKVGDELAFDVISSHLDCLGRLVTRAGGTVVKTMGDAVMASFSRPIAAVASALSIRSELEKLSCRSFAVRVGIHRGPCIAVNVGEHIDYFGNTINIAARLEHAARDGEICVSADVLRDSDVQELIGDRGEVDRVALKGVAEPIVIRRLSAV